MSKNYVGNAKAIQTQHGGMLKISLGPDDVKKIIEVAKANNGWVNLDCAKRKEPSEKGYTHSIWVNDWKPDTTQAREQLQQPQATQVSSEPDPFDDSAIPF